MEFSYENGYCVVFLKREELKSPAD